MCSTLIVYDVDMLGKALAIYGWGYADNWGVYPGKAYLSFDFVDNQTIRYKYRDGKVMTYRLDGEGKRLNGTFRGVKANFYRKN